MTHRKTKYRVLICVESVLDGLLSLDPCQIKLFKKVSLACKIG